MKRGATIQDFKDILTEIAEQSKFNSIVNNTTET